MENRPAGFIIDVPVTLSVAIRGEGLTAKEAKQIAREFAYAIMPTDPFVQGYSDTKFKGTDRAITEVSLESSTEDSCEVLEELEAEGEDDATIDAPVFTAEDRTRVGNTPDTTEDPEALLLAAQEAQAAFWDALKALEDALGFDIPSTTDLCAHDIEYLTEEFADEDDATIDDVEKGSC